MEKPHFEYRNHLRNILIAAIWSLLLLAGIKAIGLTFILLDLYTNWNPELSWIVFITVPILPLAIGWNIRFLRLKIYVDAIVFKEHGPHPTLGNSFGVAFENICQYRVKCMPLGLYWMVLKRRNGKTIRKLLSLSENEFSGFMKVLNDKVNTLDSSN